MAASQALDHLLAELADARKERSRFDNFIRSNAFVDKMTGIGNRLFFDNRLESAIMEARSGVNLPPLQLELSAMLSPDMGDESTIIPPPSYPSLAEPTTLPGAMEFLDVMTPRGKVAAGDNRDNPYLIFSPRGTSEFGVIHVALGPGHPVTILVNPWTGMAEVYREYKEFQWNLGRQSN